MERPRCIGGWLQGDVSSCHPASPGQAQMSRWDRWVLHKATTAQWGGHRCFTQCSGVFRADFVPHASPRAPHHWLLSAQPLLLTFSSQPGALLLFLTSLTPISSSLGLHPKFGKRCRRARGSINTLEKHLPPPSLLVMENFSGSSGRIAGIPRCRCIIWGITSSPLRWAQRAAPARPCRRAHRALRPTAQTRC